MPALPRDRQEAHLRGNEAAHGNDRAGGLPHPLGGLERAGPQGLLGPRRKQRREGGHRLGAGPGCQGAGRAGHGPVAGQGAGRHDPLLLRRGLPRGLGAWYQTIEKGFARNLPEKASAKHIEVLRELVDADGQPVTQGKLGETLFAKLTIRNLTKTDLPNLAITEMLPGGFEFAPPGEPHSLRPGLATRQGTDYIDVREDRALIYLGLRPEGSLSLQYALRPTCAGTFVVPPPYAEDMYEAKVRANGAAGKTHHPAAGLRSPDSHARDPNQAARPSASAG